MNIYTKLALLTFSLMLSACALTPKPAPSWPNGEEHPINKIPVTSQETK